MLRSTLQSADTTKCRSWTILIVLKSAQPQRESMRRWFPTTVSWMFSLTNQRRNHDFLDSWRNFHLIRTNTSSMTNWNVEFACKHVSSCTNFLINVPWIIKTMTVRLLKKVFVQILVLCEFTTDYATFASTGTLMKNSSCELRHRSTIAWRKNKLQWQRLPTQYSLFFHRWFSSWS